MYHIVDPDDTYAFDAIVTLIHQTGVGYIASHSPPSQVSRSHWAQNISPTWYATGEEMAHAIHGGLAQGASAPGIIMIDELNGGHRQKVYECATFMRQHYPQWEGRWGAYLVDGIGVAYPNLNTAPYPAVDALLAANAVIGPEFYPKRSDYCAADPSNHGVRDQWLSDYFYGAGPGNYGRCCTKAGRLNWLMNRRNVVGSSSPVRPLFGVTDQFLDGANPAKFLDRMFYVFVTRTGYGGLIHDSNGGPGSWKWQQPFMSNTSRDMAFKQSWEWYARDKFSASRLGPVDC